MTGPPEYVRFVRDFFGRLDEAQVRYCVLRNFQWLPEVVDGDIDLLVDPGDLRRAEILLLAEGGPLHVARSRKKNGHYQHFLVSADEIEHAARDQRPICYLEFDLVARLGWRNMEYLDSERVLSDRVRRNGFDVVSPGDHIAHLLGHAILDKGAFKSHYWSTVANAWPSHGQAVVEAMAPFIGDWQATRLDQMIVERRQAEVVGCRQRVIRHLLVRNLGNVTRFVTFHAARLLRVGRALVVPPGSLVAAVGPDGVGKSTLNASLKVLLGDLYHPVEIQYMGWKDFALPTKGFLVLLKKVVSSREKVKTETKYENIESMDMPWTHNLSILHYYFDLMVRWVLRIWVPLARGGVVLCDRYFYDVLTHKVFLTRSALLRRILVRIAPRPDVIVSFAGDVEIISQRKEENSPAETQRQLDCLREVELGDGRVVRLDATRSVAENCVQVLRRVFGMREADVDRRPEVSSHSEASGL